VDLTSSALTLSWLVQGRRLESP